MASLNQSAERVAIALGKEKNIAYLEVLKYSINHYRALFIRRDIARNEISDGYLQRVTLPVHRTDLLEELNISVGKCVSKTVDPIPTPIRLKTSSDFKFVGSLLTGEAFIKADEMTSRDFEYSRGSSEAILYNYRNTYLEFYNACGLKYVTIVAAFENPKDVNEVATPDTCITDDADYPCPADILQEIELALIKGELQLINDNQEITINEER